MLFEIEKHSEISNEDDILMAKFTANVPGNPMSVYSFNVDGILIDTGSSSKVITVDPKYTSQTCPKCGHIEKANRNKKLHTFTCKNCQYQSNDDRIGAMNLHRKGIEQMGVVALEV